MANWAGFSISRSRRSYMTEAITEAVKSPLSCKHGCVIVRNGKIISRGHNHFKRGKHSAKRSTHAEIDAITKLGDMTHLRDADLYVVRIGKDLNGQIIVRNSQPCETCFPKLIKCMESYGLRTVFYSVNSQFSSPG